MALFTICTSFRTCPVHHFLYDSSSLEHMALFTICTSFRTCPVHHFLYDSSSLEHMALFTLCTSFRTCPVHHFLYDSSTFDIYGEKPMTKFLAKCSPRCEKPGEVWTSWWFCLVVIMVYHPTKYYCNWLNSYWEKLTTKFLMDRRTDGRTDGQPAFGWQYPSGLSAPRVKTGGGVHLLRYGMSFIRNNIVK